MIVGGAKRRVADHVLHAVADAEGEAGGGAGDGAAGGPGDVAEGGAEGDHAVPAVEQLYEPGLVWELYVYKIGLVWKKKDRVGCCGPTLPEFTGRRAKIANRPSHVLLRLRIGWPTIAVQTSSSSFFLK